MPPVLLPLLLAALGVHLLGWAWVGAGLRRVREGQPDPEAPPLAVPVSVVVAARDEEDALPALLDALHAQTHRDAAGRPLFEVVVVDDRSADATASIVRGRANAWAVTGGPDLRLLSVAPGEPEAAGLPPKKHALARGIAAARHDRLAFTDADGRPPPTWLAALVRQLDAADDEAVLVGYGPYRPRAGWLNRFVRYETVQTATLAAGAIGWGRPWHAVGRNLSYPRALFERLGGFAHSAASLSGDDDLFVQEVGRRRAAPVRYVLDPAAHVPSEAPSGSPAFWRQKRRHASAGGHYPAAVLAALGLFHTSNLVLWLGAPLLHLLTGSPMGWGLLAVKLLLQRTALGPTFDDLGAEGDLRLGQPVLDGLSAGYHAVLAVLGTLPAPRRW